MSAGYKIIELVDKADAVARPHRFFVAFTFPADRQTVQSCLSYPSVAGVILTDEAASTEFDDPSHVVYRFGQHSSSWSFPSENATAIVVLGGTEAVGLRIAGTAMHHKIKLFTHAVTV